MMGGKNLIVNNLNAFVHDTTRVLIIGSMPSVQSVQKKQYYGNPRNHFWGIIAHLTNEHVPDVYEERLDLLRRHGIGLWDAIASCERQGSLDAAIKQEVPNDFAALFRAYPQIEAVFFNGGKAFTVFKRHVGLDVLAERHYEQLPSTSPIPGKNIKSFDEKIDVWRAIERYI